MPDDIRKTMIKMFDLARLHYDPSESSRYIANAEKVIKYFDKLSKLGIPSKGGRAFEEGELLLSDDDVKEFDGAGKIIEQAPERDGAFVQVPKVI